MRVLCFLGLVALAALATAAPAPKAQPTEYIGVADLVDAANHIKDVFNEIKAKIESGVIKGEIADFLQHIKDVVEAKIKEAKPVVAEILGQMKAAVQDMIDQVKSGVEQIKPVLQELAEKIMAKIAELKDKIIGGYNIFDDLLNDVLKPALGKAIENLIPTIQKHLGDLIGKLVPSEYVEYLAITDVMEIAQHIKDIFKTMEGKIESGEVKDNVVDFLNKLKAAIDAKIEAAKPIVKAALEKIKAAIEDIKAKAEAGVEQGKGLLAQLLEKIMAKLAELKDHLAGYNIFDDLLNDVLKPALKHAIENLIPTIGKHLGDLADKLKPSEYMAISDIHDIVQKIKDIFKDVKAKIESGEVKGNVVDFLNKIKAAVEAKIAEAKPIVKAALEKVKAAIDELIAKAKADTEAGIEAGKGLLGKLLAKIIAKLAELKDQIQGYNIFDDLLNDVLKPALGKAIENLIPTIQKHLGDLIGKLVPGEFVEYVGIEDVMAVAQHIKDIFNKLKAAIESGEVKADVIDFLNKLKAIVDEKIAAATPVVKTFLEKVEAAIEDIKAKAAAGIESGKGLLADLWKKIMEKFAEVTDQISGFNIFDDLLNDVLKPALGKAIENLIPTIQKHLGDLIGKLVPSEYVEYLAITDIMEIAQHIKDIFNEVKAKIESGEVKDNIVDFLNKLKAAIDARIEAAKPVVKAALEKVKAAVEEIKAKAEAGIEQGKGLLAQLLERIMAKLAELKDNLAGYNIFDDLLNDVLKPALKHAIENLIPTIGKHLGDLADKLKPKEYISITEVMEAVQDLKDIFAQVKAKIESGEVKDNIIDFLNKIKAAVDAKIAAATPAVKAILEKVDAAVQAIIAKAKAGVESGKGLLVDLLETIIAKIGELKDNLTGYNIFDDLLNDVLKPALGKAIENLIPTIQKHLGDLIGKLVPSEYVEYLAISDILEIAQHIKDIFNELKGKIESGEVKDNVVDFLNKLKAVVDAKIEAAKPVVKAALEKIKAAIENIKAKAEAGVEQGKGLLVQLLEQIMAKLAELKDNLAGYNIFDDLLHDVLKPALKHAIENLIPTISKHLGDLIDKLKPAEYMALSDIMEIVQKIKDTFNEVKDKIESGEVKDNVVDFLTKIKAAIDAKIAEAKPIVKAALEKVKAAIDELIAKAKADAEAGVEAGKGLLVQLLEKIMAKLAEMKDSVAGYNIFDDLLNDVLKPAIKHAIENLIPTIGKHLGDLADKLKPKEYIGITEIMEAVMALKDIFNQVKAKIESGVVQDNIIDFLNQIKATVDAKIAAATPAVKAILEKVDAAVQVVIEKAKAGVESGKGLLVDLLETIIAKISELKDNIAGYNIFEDLLNDVLKPALKHAIENLIPTIGKHLGDLADKLKPKEYIGIAEIMEAVQDLKDIFAQVKAKIESGEVKDNIIDFLNKIKAAVDAKIAAATPAVKAILEKVDAAVQAIIAKAKAGVESGKGLLVDLLETIIAKIGELKDNLAGYNIFEDLLNDVLKPALKHAIENLIPTIGKHLGDLADKLKPKEYISLVEIMEAVQDLKDIFAQVKAKIESGEVKDNIIDFLNKIKAAVDAKIAAATPAVKAILEKVDAAIQAIIAKAKAGVESGKGLLVDLLETIIAKIGELKDNLTGYNIFDDLLNDVLKPALKHAIENLIPTIGKHLGDLADKLKPKEYISLVEIMEAVQDLKDIFAQVKAKIESGEVKDNIIDFLNKIKAAVDAKIAAATPAVKAILEKVDAAVQAIIAKAKAGVESGKGLLVDLLETIIAKIGELKDNIAGYNIFEDLLNDVLKPALKHAIENLIPTIGKHLGDLADKLKPSQV